MVPSGAAPSDRAAPRTSSQTSIFSSGGNRLGTSPVFSRVFISSKKLLSVIWESVIRKTVGSPIPPAFLKNYFRFSYQRSLL